MQTMRRVEDGDLHVRSQVSSRTELGQLSDSFDHMIAKTAELMDERLRSEEQKRKSEWKALQAQIQPHFLYNTLDSIIWMSHAGRNAEVVEMTSALALLLRSSIGDGSDTNTLKKEIAHVRSYLTIQKMRYNEKLRYEIDLDPQTEDCLLPKLILQPLVENAIYHGIKVKQQGGTVRIESLLEEDRLLITVEDDGVGMTAEEVRKYINQVAFSGAKTFMEEYAKNEDQENSGIIGHFGLGFYSVFMIADKVTIDTLSFREGATPVRWESEDGMAFTMTEGTRATRGTTITLHVSEAESEFLEVWRVREVLDRYCSFMSVPIYLDEIKEEEAKVTGEGDNAEDKPEEKKEEPKPINDTQPLYARAPQDCTDEDYKQFYRKVFHEYEDPLFWIHLNVDYPFKLKGILYFPKIHNNFEIQKNKIQLYSNQVYVTDQVEGIVPEYLTLLHGVIDSPDIPLNVSRSYLQSDSNVKKISSYITRKVADRLQELFNTMRADYESKWDCLLYTSPSPRD